MRVLVPDGLQILGLKFNQHGVEATSCVTQISFGKTAVVLESWCPITQVLHLHCQKQSGGGHQRVLHVH